MDVYTKVLGNIHSPEWHERAHQCKVESIFLDQWTAQKSRFLAKSDEGKEYPVALMRQTQVVDGDVLDYDPEAGTMLVIRLNLNPVMVIDMKKLLERSPEEMMRRCVELGHAIGNQHWPAVVKGTKVYVPLTVDRKVMLSVMETHHLEDIDFTFEEGQEVIPYMAPHEIRRLFGGASHHTHHIHGDHEHADGHIVK